MTKKVPRKLLVIFLALGFLSLLVPRSSHACGPFFSDAIFVYTKHPDFPLEKYAAGKLGIVESTWARSYLVVAYRTLSGSSLSPIEVTAMKSLWDERINLSSESNDEQWIKKWKDARATVPGLAAAPEINAYRNREKPREYESYLNCQQDAFDNAVVTLKARISRFGASSSQVHDWVTAQDTVFSNCSAGKQIPDAAGGGADELARADRAYQIAAANFYAGGFDDAAKQFDEISKDRSSPWRDKAPYLAARAILRKGSFAEKDPDREPPLTEAESRLNAILKDKALGSIHAAAQRLLNLVRLRLHPEEKLHELAQTITKKDNGTDFKQTVWDYTVLLDKFVGEDTENKTPAPVSVRTDEITDWILTFEDEAKEAATHSSEQWRKTQSLPWLVAALTTAKAGQPNIEALLSAAGKVARTSPAFASVAFHRVRLLTEAKRADEARAELDRILTTERENLPSSALNSFLSQRMNLARTLEEFLQSAQRKPAGFSDNNDGREIPDEENQTKEVTKGSKLFFDLDAANALNKGTPVGVLKDAARSRTLADNLRRDVAQATFMRAALLDEREAAMQAAPVLQGFYPELKEFLAAYQQASTPDGRRFAASFMALKFPGLRPYVSAGVGRTTELKEIDSYRDNYWCAEPSLPQGGYSSEDEEAKKKAMPVTVEFLKPTLPLAARQLAELQGLGTAPNFLCKTAIAWTEKNPNDPRSPEALHLAVRSTRYGCTDSETGRWSKAAFDLLHKRYPNTVWAKNTKYWFKG